MYMFKGFNLLQIPYQSLRLYHKHTDTWSYLILTHLFNIYGLNTLPAPC
jgi:hypothetical protein